jgi:hypothetical protein
MGSPHAGGYLSFARAFGGNNFLIPVIFTTFARL